MKKIHFSEEMVLALFSEQISSNFIYYSIFVKKTNKNRKNEATKIRFHTGCNNKYAYEYRKL